MISHLKTFDLTVNQNGKVDEKSTQIRVTGEVLKQPQSEKQSGNVKIDTRLTFSNLLHAKCINLFHDVIKNNLGS